MVSTASSLAFPKARGVVVSLAFRRLGRVVVVRFSVVVDLAELDSFERAALEGVSIAPGIFLGGLDGFEEECMR